MRQFVESSWQFIKVGLNYICCCKQVHITLKIVFTLVGRLLLLLILHFVYPPPVSPFPLYFCLNLVYLSYMYVVQLGVFFHSSSLPVFCVHPFLLSVCYRILLKKKKVIHEIFYTTFL